MKTHQKGEWSMVLAENLVMLRNVKGHDTGTGRRGQ